MKTIVIPTDFSQNALKAFEFVNDFFAEEGQYQYEIVTVYNIPHGGTSSLFMLLEQLQKQAEQDMENLMQILERDFPKIAKTSRKHILKGGFTDQVTAICRQNKANFIVMGTKGATGMKEILMGSNTARLVKDANYPVFAIPQEYERENIKNLLLSYDGKELSDRTVDFIRELSKYAELPIHLFHVRKQADEPIQNWAEIEDRFDDHHISLYEAYASTFEEGLSSEIINLNAILILVSRQKTFWDRLTKKSETAKALMHLHLPMLALPE